MLVPLAAMAWVYSIRIPKNIRKLNINILCIFKVYTMYIPALGISMVYTWCIHGIYHVKYSLGFQMTGCSIPGRYFVIIRGGATKPSWCASASLNRWRELDALYPTRRQHLGTRASRSSELEMLTVNVTTIWSSCVVVVCEYFAVNVLPASSESTCKISQAGPIGLSTGTHNIQITGNIHGSECGRDRPGFGSQKLGRSTIL